MNDKQTIINQIIADMIELNSCERDKLRMILLYRLKDFDLIPIETLPAVGPIDNAYILEQFAIGKYAESREKSSVDNYLYILRAFFRESGLLWSSVTGGDVAMYLATRRYRDHISESYLKCIQKALCSFYGWIYKHKYLSFDLRDEIPISKAPQKIKVRLSDDEIECCRKVAIDGFERALLELMLSTGMRIGEIVNLSIEDLNFEKREIQVYGQKTNQWRCAYMTPQCYVYLSQYIGSRTSGPVFLGKKHASMCADTIERTARSIALRAGCKVRATVHVYRKTFASVLYRKTNDALLVSKLLGHCKVDTTIKYYLVDDVEAIKYKVMKSF